MSITRIGITEPSNGMPILSRAVVRGDTVYLSGVVPDPVGDVTTQTRQVLEKIDQLLHGAGSDKSKLVTAQIWLANMADFAAMNAVWNAWVDPKNPPARACVRSDMYRPEVLVEIMVTAGR